MCFIATSIALNLYLAILITRKLRAFRKALCHARCARNNGNVEGQGNDPYSPIIAVVVDSATAWIAVALTFLVALGVRAVAPISSDVFYTAEAATFFLEYIFQITVVSRSPSFIHACPDQVHC
jgi:hypothetical protein